MYRTFEFPQSYVVWDLETTGFLESEDPRILEVAVAVVSGHEVVDSWSALLNHGIDIPEKATAVHGITREMCEKEGLPPAQVIGRLMDHLEAADAHVTHNGIRFDIPFLLAHLHGKLVPDIYEITAARLKETAIDTAAMYKAGKMRIVRGWNEPYHAWAKNILEMPVPGLKYNVGVCCDDLGISREGVTQHRALADVLLTQKIFRTLSQRV